MSSSWRRSVGGVGDERLDHAFVGHRGELALEAAALLGEQCGEPADALAQRLDPREHVGDVVVAGGGERVLGVEHRDVERRAAARGTASSLAVELGAAVAEALAPGLEAGDLATGEVEADRAQLVDEPVVAAGGVGLASRAGGAGAAPRAAGR